jgi:hypothetical protein
VIILIVLIIINLFSIFFLLRAIEKHETKWTNFSYMLIGGNIMCILLLIFSKIRDLF